MELLREFYRIPYPEFGRPTLEVNGVSIPVLDLSERGARVVMNTVFHEQCPPRDIRIVFSDRGEFRTRASFVWTDAATMAIRFDELVPFSRIITEQLRLREQESHLD